MAASWRNGRKDSEPIKVLVVERDDDIRRGLSYLLKVEGYAVREAETLHEAETLIDAAPEPMVLIVGDADVVDYPDLQHFMAVATNPVTCHAFIYHISTPQRGQIPTLVQAATSMPVRAMDQPYELAFLLAVVADAAAHARSQPVECSHR